MRHEDYKELLSLEAVGALDAGETRALEEHLSSCGECRAELREMSDAASALAFTVAPVAPPAHLRSRVLEQVRGLAPSTQAEASRALPSSSRVASVAGASSEVAGASETVGASEATAASEVAGASGVARETSADSATTSKAAFGVEDARRLLARMSLWQIFAARPSLALGAGAAAVAFVLLGVTSLALRGRNATLQAEVVRLYERLHQSQEEMVRAHEQLARARDMGDMLASPEASVMQLAGKDAAPRARAVVAYERSTGRAVLLATGLPPAPAGRAYQLWLIAENKPLPGGTFKSDTDGRARMSDHLPAGVRQPTFAVTLEREGGESAPKGEMYLLGSGS
ncbi:MAG: anti-sigma factor [Acidobacteriota bacterium]|nr:anti-sigma factor [Acidobacteriota bacterium]MDQ5835864.1 anti-sigma factor [Acidobacteriota bacterium]